MTPHLSIQMAEPAYDAFLFAAIGEEGNGMTLSVLSGLSRLDIDPWDEAARLSLLPKDRAIAALGRRIACLPSGNWQPSDLTGIASRLVELLPRHDALVPADSPVPPSADKKRPGSLTLWLIAAALAAFLLLGMPTRVERLLSGDGVVAPVLMPSSEP
jgi:hypothetical protein